MSTLSACISDMGHGGISDVCRGHGFDGTQSGTTSLQTSVQRVLRELKIDRQGLDSAHIAHGAMKGGTSVRAFLCDWGNGALLHQRGDNGIDQ